MPLLSIVLDGTMGTSTTIPNSVANTVAYTPADATDKALSWTVCTAEPTECSPDTSGHCRTCVPSTTLGTVTSGTPGGVYTPPATVSPSPLDVYLLACQGSAPAAICDWTYVAVTEPPEASLITTPVDLANGWFAGDPNDAHQPGVTVGTATNGFVPVTEISTPGIDGSYLLGQAQTAPAGGGQLYTCSAQLRPGSVTSVFLQIQAYGSGGNNFVVTLTGSGSVASPAGFTGDVTYDAPTYTATVTAPFPVAMKDAGGDSIPVLLCHRSQRRHVRLRRRVLRGRGVVCPAP